MQNFSSWILNCIREMGHSMSWMEEKRFEWIPIVATSIEKLIDAQTFLLITDQEREWFCDYIVKKINKSTFNRPLLPIVTLKSIFSHIDSIDSDEKLALLDDMLSLSFPNGYSYFYIGKGDTKGAYIAKSKNDSLLWLLDERVENSFYLSTKDEDLDIKLIQLILLYDKSIDAVLFGEVDIEGSL